MNQNLDKLLRHVVESNSSDLHLTEGQNPYIRYEGQLREIDNFMNIINLKDMLNRILSNKQFEKYSATGNLDFGFSYNNVRFRGHVYKQGGKMSAAIRKLESNFRTLNELGLPGSLNAISKLRDGLVLVTGATGSGKSTTLATIINEINSSSAKHILTIEDPIEYIHKNKKSLVHQRELFTDVDCYPSAVRASLREDPDVVLIGEMRDVETMRAAIRLAETGHLVFSTLHTSSACGTLERIVGSFPSDEQDSIIHQLSITLKTIITQRLIKSKLGDFRIPVLEILHVNSAVGNMMRQRKSNQIYAIMENSKAMGMQTIEQDLTRLIEQGHVDLQTALAFAEHPNLLQRMNQ